MGGFLGKNAFDGNLSSIYCHSYDASQSPAEAAVSLFQGTNSVFHLAIEKWLEGKGPTLEEVPNRFVVVAEGAAGLAVREYIQSKAYQGEIENVVFFNTPHEGTGFADQALLNGSSVLNKSKSASDYSEIIPLALAVYLVGGSDVLEDLMMALLKEAVLGMAQNAGSLKERFSAYFVDSEESYKSLLYLAQDLDLSDAAYEEVKRKAQGKSLDVGEFAGSTQLLNSYSKLNSYNHPAYGNVYSYGLPTIGNGRRTLADFADQSKNHVSKENLRKMLTESISATLVENGKEFVPEDVESLVANAMNGNLETEAAAIANQIATRYKIPVGRISECVRDISSLSRLKFNKENFSKSVLNVIRIANKYLPEKYKSELFSTFIDEYSTTLAELGESVKSIEENLKNGMGLVSNNLSNYAIHFFDEGTFDVPAVSAFGKNVRAFQESGAIRIGYSLKDYVRDYKTDFPDLNDYLDNVSKAGEWEGIRQNVDLGLKLGCGVVESFNPVAGKACRATQFMTNVTFIAKVSSNVEKAMKMVGALKSAKYVALRQSMVRKSEYSSWQDHSGVSHGIESSDLESMLFGTPIVSLQTVHKKEGELDSIVPLALYRTFGKVESYADISNDSIAYGYSYPASEFTEIGRNALENSSCVMFKDVQSEQRNGFLHRDSRYAAADGFEVQDFVREYRFIIDDFQPDSLRLLKLDFNARMQIVYERDGDVWYIYRAVDNRLEETPIDTLLESPVQKYGLFVFRPKEIFNRGIRDAKDSILLSAIQEDGANCVNIYVVNKIGRANNQRVYFKFQAVDYLIEDGWPKSFETVSGMDTVDIYSNDIGYGASLGEFRLVVSNSKYRDTVQVFVDSLQGSGSRYRFWADLSAIWQEHPLENSTYTLKWDLGFKVKTLKADYTTGEQERFYMPQTIVRGDTSKPNLAFGTIRQISSLKRGDILATVLNLDSATERSLRGFRSFIVRRDAKDTVALLHRAHVGEPSYEIRWDGDSASWSGTADLYVQAYDFANPNRSLEERLARVVQDSGKSSWAFVLRDSAFMPGINGISLHKTILVDNEAPRVMSENFEIQSFADDSQPPLPKRENADEISLNAMDTLIFSFDIGENLFSRDSESVVVEMVFEDSIQFGAKKRFLSEWTINKNSNHFTFQEPDANRLEDGIYTLTVFLTDEAGNKSTYRIGKKFRVDRTSPQVRGISLGDVAYASVSELKKGSAHISQGSDDERNRSDLQCYVNVYVGGKNGAWTKIGVESESKNATSSMVEFDIRSALSDTSHGSWSVYFGCYDAVGNFGKNMNRLGMGARYPEITYPQNASELYNGQVLVRGIAPNPTVHGNDNAGEFRIFWKALGDSSWSENGIRYLIFDRSLSAAERDLAIWNPAELNLAQGSYALKLAVRSCDTCEWIFEEKTVAVDDLIQIDSANTPKIVIAPPVGNRIAGKLQDASIELKNVSATSNWIVKASVEVPSPKDSTTYVRAVDKTFEPMTVSPFRNPATASDTGLSIWQEDDGSTWHVRYAGSAQGLKISGSVDSATARRNPYLAIRFVDGNIDWGFSAKADSSESLDFIMDSVRVRNEFVDLLIPPYNATWMWSVEKDSVHLVFKTSAPFAVDVSAIEDALCRETNSSVAYIHPENYKAHVTWNGLVNGAFSSGSLVKMNVIAYEKGNEKNVLSGNAEWFLEYEDTGIEISTNNLEKYYVNFLGSNSSEVEMADYGFQFKLTGRSAYVTAEILDSAKNVVRSLLDNELVLATSANQWETLRWNGVKDDGLVQPGAYNVHLLVKNDTGVVIDTLYPFVMSLGQNIIEAKMDSVGRIADLKMDEAFLDEEGNFRYVGRPDYRLRTDLSATFLPESERTFEYEWGVEGTQSPIVYKKTRPSIGIRRQRDEFWATVVTLVMSETRVYQISYKGLSRICKETGEAESRGYYYRIEVKKQKFKKGETPPEIWVDLDPVRDEQWRVFGYLDNSNDAPQVLHNLAAIKVLPASSYAEIVKKLGDSTFFSNAVWDADTSSAKDFPWERVYQKGAYSKDSTQMLYWFNNWGGQTLYYEAVNTSFNIVANADSLKSTFYPSVETSCETDFILNADLGESDAKFVCGAKNAKEEIDTNVIAQYNPHAYMLNVQLKPFDGEESFVRKDYDKKYCEEMDHSGTDIKVKFILNVNSDYWDPPTWGTNNLANRYVRFDPANRTLYGSDGYIAKLQNDGIPNFYDGTRWVSDASLNNGPTVFEAQRLPMVQVPENPLLFNDELNATVETLSSTSEKFYPSEYSWRFYRGSGIVAYKAAAHDMNGNLLSVFNSNESDAVNGKDKIVGTLLSPLDIYFDVAPLMNFENAKMASAVMASGTSLPYPLVNGNCPVNAEAGYRFYGCDKWVSHLHLSRKDWNDSLWKRTFALADGTGYIRNPLTDVGENSEGLTEIENAKRDSSVREKFQHNASPDEWNAKENRWKFSLKNPESDVDEIFGKISIGRYILKPEENDSGWEIDSSGVGVFTVFNKGRAVGYSGLDFYRSKDSVFTSANSLNNGQHSEKIPLAKVLAQNSSSANSIFASEWAKNHSAEVVGIFKRNFSNDSLVPHPYLEASYDSVSKQFHAFRNSSDIYASRENEIVTLRGSVPYDGTKWNISYIWNGMRFKIAEGTTDSIEASMNVNELQGNTSFFLTYGGSGNVTYYRKLDVRIGERVKANEESFVYSMYGNVFVHFDKGSWEKDEDVTVRTMEPGECSDCRLFRNMTPVGPVLEVLPSHVFPEDKGPIVTVDVSMASLKKDGVDYRNLKIYKLDAERKEIIPLENEGPVVLLDANLNVCESTDPYSCAFARISAKTQTFSKFVVLDSQKADSVEIAESVPEKIETFACSQMDSLWTDTLWMGTANGWLEYPYPCSGKSNYLLQLGSVGTVAVEHRGASANPIVWAVRNSDIYTLDSAYQSSIVFYGVDGNTEQKFGPVVRLDSVAPVIENVETEVFEMENGSRKIHMEAEIEENGSGIAQTTVELFWGGNLLESVSILGDQLPTWDFIIDSKNLYDCVGCKATVKVRVEDKGHNSDNVVKQTEKISPYPSSLVLWYPFSEGFGDIGYEVMTRENSRRMHMDLSAVENPWNGRYGVSLYKITDSASSRFQLPRLDSLSPFTVEFNFNSGYIQRNDWAVLSFVGKNEWTFGVGTYNRYFLRVCEATFYFNTKRDAGISTHLALVVDGNRASLYKNGEFAESIQLDGELPYGGGGRLAIGTRNGIRSAVGSLSNLRFYSSALTAEQIQSVYRGRIDQKSFYAVAVRAVSLADREGLLVDQSCSAPGKSYLVQNSADNLGAMTWDADVKSDSYALYLLHRSPLTEKSHIEVTVDGIRKGIFSLTSTGLWKSEKVAGLELRLQEGFHEIQVRPLGNLGVAALALASTSANLDGNQMDYNESSWENPEPKAKVIMKYESVDDESWAQIRFDLRNKTGEALENARIRYYYKGEGEKVNALSFYPSSPMRVVNDAGSVFYAELALTEAIAAYGAAYFGEGPLVGLHRLTPPNDHFPNWDKTDDPSYVAEAETDYAEALGVALLDGEGNLLNEFSCYDEDGPVQKSKIKVRAMAKDDASGSPMSSNLAIYVENVGQAPVNGFEVRYYFRDSVETEVDVNWNAFASFHKFSAGGDLHYASFKYDLILNSGDKSDYGNGVQFSIHHPNWTSDFNAADDPSHYGLDNLEMAEADSIVVLDSIGNLLWGNAPQPKFSAEYVTGESNADLVYRDGDVIYVSIGESGHYILETVNALGVPLKTLYQGSWDVGEHSLTLDMKNLQPSSYIVLRKGMEILSWKLLN